MNARNLLFVAATLLWLACSNETPTPSATPPPKPPSPTAAAPLATEGLMRSSPADDAVRALSNEPSLDTTLMPAAPGATAAANTTTFGPFVAALPAGWETTQPSSSMRVAQFKFPAAEGDTDPAELVIYFFPGGAGGKEPNLRRWASQFQGDPDEMYDRARIEDKKLGVFDVTLFDLSGTFTAPSFGGGGGGGPKPNHRMLVAIVNTDQGPYYAKAVGPEKTMAAQAKAFELFIASLRIK